MAIKTTSSTAKHLIEKLSTSLKHSLAKVGKEQNSELYEKTQISRQLQKQKINQELSMMVAFMRMH